MARAQEISIFNWPIMSGAAIDAFYKLHPAKLAKNPIIFICAIAALVACVQIVEDVWHGNSFAFSMQIAAWLWFTVLFANFSEAVAEGRGKAQAATLRKNKSEVMAKLMNSRGDGFKLVPAADLHPGDIVLVEAGDVIPSDGEIVEGIATVDESAITGESAPVIRESGGDRSAVTGGTRVLSDVIKVRITAKSGDTFIDRMIALVEGAQRSKTPCELSLTVFLIGLTIIFVVMAASLSPLFAFAGGEIKPMTLAALVVTLIPTTIGGLLSAIGIAGMDRLVRFNVLAMSGRAVEAAGDVDVLLLDKTGTITLGNRVASELVPAPGVTDQELADAAQLASLSDETPEGRSITVLVKEKYNLRGRDMSQHIHEFVPFTAQTRMSGIDIDGKSIRKGAVDAVLNFVASFHEGEKPALAAIFQESIDRIAKSGGTPLMVAMNGRIMGAIHLKDVIKGGIKERFIELRRMGIRTVMITGDNPLTAGAIAAESGVDDFLAQATPEMKLKLIRKEQALGRLVAMCGDGTNDAPALAQADVGVAMNTGTAAAREAGNMIDLDSDPTKLIEIVGIGKQLLMTRGALTTFSISNDVAKYFAIIPAMFITVYPELKALNIMNLGSAQSAILSAVIFNAIIIIALIPLALKGVKYRAEAPAKALRRNLFVYGLGGVIVPFIGIKAIDLLLVTLGLA
jgi:K+-transporting ATPase ATPase B chain